MTILTKVEQARELAAIFAEEEATDVTPEEVTEMSDYDSMDFMQALGFVWDGMAWYAVDD